MGVGTALEAVRVVTGGRRDGARRLADDAITACLDAAGIAASDVDVLINCGIYRDGNLGEPALAALIQGDVAANPGHPPSGGHGTFSFDLAAGECGPVTAMQVIDGFLRSGVARRGLIVASDADPGHHLARDFPYRPVGAAALLSATPGPSGFTAFTAQLFPDHAGDLRAEVRWEPRPRRSPWGPPGANVLVLEQSPDLLEHATASAQLAVHRTLDELGLALEDVAVVVTPDAGGLGAAVVAALGRPGVIAGEGAHTAGVLAALARAEDEGHLDEGRALVVTVSAGLHVSCALHESPR